MKMPLGKHSGKDVGEVPSSYLRWLEKQDWLKDDLRAEIQYVLKRREEGAFFEPEEA